MHPAGPLGLVQELRRLQTVLLEIKLADRRYRRIAEPVMEQGRNVCARVEFHRLKRRAIAFHTARHRSSQMAPVAQQQRSPRHLGGTDDRTEEEKNRTADRRLARRMSSPAPAH
jgi:hypothetical protein